MTRNEFIRELNNELLKNKVPDIEEIISEFEEHFRYKLEEGYSEEEIAKRIGNPVDLANDYVSNAIPNKSKGKLLRATGLGFVDLFVVPTFITLWASVLVLPALALTTLVLGVCLIFDQNIASLIPNMPYISSLTIGVSMLGLATMSTIGSVHVYLYVKQWGKAYLRWHKNVMNNFIYPSLSKHPRLSKRLASKMKLVNMIGTLVFIATFVVGFFLSVLLAESFEFWHVWGWFV